MIALKMQEGQIAAASRFFSASVFREMAFGGRSPLLIELIKETGLFGLSPERDNVAALFDKAFDVLKVKHARNEYIYKAALTHKVLLGEHNLRTASMLTEFRAESCKVDYVILNGTATAYEIKSERDSLARLEKQVHSYMNVFARVNVIAGENHIDSILNLVPKEVGVMKLTKRFTINTVRAAVNRPERTNPLSILDSMQLREAKNILKELGLDIPDVPNTCLYEELRNTYIKLKSVDVHRAMVNTLKVTRNLMPLQELMNDIPKSLQPMVLSTNLKKKETSRLLSAINTPLCDAIKWI